MAVVLPLILLLLFVTAEIGRAFMQYNTLTKSVRDSARFLAENAMLGQTQTISIDANLLLQTQNLVVYGSVNSAGLTPLLPGLTVADVQAAAASVDDISVTATYSYLPMSPFIKKFGFGPDSSAAFTFQAQATMRAL
jgi:Flp pilus assembly protein TadG